MVFIPSSIDEIALDFAIGFLAFEAARLEPYKHRDGLSALFVRS